MSCEEIKQTLSLYVDDCVSLPARAAIEDHLPHCPLCRIEVSELRSLTRGLSLMKRPVPPSDLASNITDLLIIEAAARRQDPNPSLGYRIARFLEPRLMPYTVGSFASVIMFALMFAALRPHFVALREAAIQHSVLVLQTTDPDGIKPITSKDFAASRAPFAELSPSLKPGGALAELTRAYAQSGSHSIYHGDADDMIVVAVVFSDGAAALADVVQPPRDRRMLEEFESALRRDRAFVPASYDRRPETMRVVLTMEKVEVDDRDF